MVRVAKVGLLLLCAAAVNLAAPPRSEAQLLYNAWNSIFGGPWSSGYYGSYYGPTYSGYYGPSYSYASYSPAVYSAGYLGTTSYHAPAYGVSMYGPSCCPTTCCMPCCDPCAPACASGPGPAYGACTAGTDAQSYSGAPLHPTPAGGTRPGIPRTFSPENGTERPPMSPMNQSPATNGASPYGEREEGFKRREEPMAPFDGTSTSSESFRFQGPAEKVPQRTNPADGDTPDADTEKTGGELRLPPIGLDDKITWRSAPERTRLSVRSTFKTTVLARAKVEPNSEWLPVKDATKIVKK